jgi:uncharacterized protein
MAETKPRGRFVWYDLMTTDPAKAAEFYTRVIGWGTSNWEAATAYTMWTNNSVPLGGVMTLPPEAGAPHWLAYISTSDMNATVRQTTDLGGKVLIGPKDVPTVGSFAVLKDPQGATFAAFTSASDSPGQEGPPQPGEFSWHELATHDHPAALRFYQALFGWEKTSYMDMGEMGGYQMYGRNGVELGGMFNKPADMPGSPAWLHYIMVEDVHRAVEAAKGQGARIVNGPMEVPGGDWIAQGMDPQGAMFAVHSKKR